MPLNRNVYVFRIESEMNIANVRSVSVNLQLSNQAYTYRETDNGFFVGTFIEIAIFLMKMRCMREKDSSSQSKTREYFDFIIPIMLKFSSIFTRIASTLQMSSTNQLHPFDTRLQKVWLEPRNRIVFGKHQTHARHES